MKVIAVNGSPRKQWNTATLLKKALDGAASVGADTELINLYELNYKGCSSCFACKRKGGVLGHCAMKDDLTNVLEKIINCDVLLLGTPIYFGNITGEMLCFLERLFFSSMTYNTENRSTFPGKLSASGFVYTMNFSIAMMDKFGYERLFNSYKTLLERLGAPSEVFTSNDTYQFDDYSKYEASLWNEQHKAKVKAEQFPIDCSKAFELGARLAKK
ncbi:flavodoxin family protein [Clostridium sp. 19966]|uniref:flavodoxin family protein n=1 Tax=Clostridium sp. 19966 TaxID=2768166 RepID=UPI0028DF4C71|nr:flavodoxin family protein [Clostridium sp. 19966]MDT8716966.1 flavodoxin family protein [Clostridium sp. 19966]